jgi:hypothetical protein
MKDVFPICLDQEGELFLFPEGSRLGVKPEPEEKRGICGLPCAFCNRYYHSVGSGLDQVGQCQVTVDGNERKRWGGGELVWKCGRCDLLKKTVTLDQRIEVSPIVPESTAEQVRTRVARVAFDIAQRTKW